MMAPPLTDLPRPDLVLVTHAHTDHMDPETLGPLAKRFPDLPFVVPEARAEIARQRIGGRLIGMDADESLSPLPGLKITALPAAHEGFDRDNLGRHPCLGCRIETPGLAICHSGDCIPYPGLAQRLAERAPDIALLPVNGRGQGVPGSFTLAEALEMGAQIPWIIAHHWGMFAFNTLDPARIDQAALTRAGLLRPKAGDHFRIP